MYDSYCNINRSQFYTETGNYSTKLQISFLLHISGLFFSIFNSMANPIIYTILMPSYRQAMVAALCPCKRCKRQDMENSSVASPTSNNVVQQL